MRKKVKRHREQKLPLPEEIRAEIEEGCYSIKVRIEIESDVQDNTARRFGQELRGQIIFESQYDDEAEIGYIEAFKCRLTDPSDAEDWADEMDTYAYDSYRWLISYQTKFNLEELFLFSKPLLIKTVFIEPEWRGLGFVLPAVATFIDLTESEFVFLQPHPVNNPPTADQLKREVQTMTRLWKKLGLRECGGKKLKGRAYLAGYWQCPDWLAGLY